MSDSKVSDSKEKIRSSVALKIRELRRSRRWSQAELAKRLGLSQNRLSELENGDGSFSAEQLILALRLFNITVNDIIGDANADQAAAIQNAVARLGATHLQEQTGVLPSEQLGGLRRAVFEGLVDGSPRIVTSLAPVLVRHSKTVTNLASLYSELFNLGLERRLPWLIDNALVALDELRNYVGAISTAKKAHYRQANLALRFFLEHLERQSRSKDRQEAPPDVLDSTIRSSRTYDDVLESRSDISKKWNVVTTLQPRDFLVALEAANAVD